MGARAFGRKHLVTMGGNPDVTRREIPREKIRERGIGDAVFCSAMSSPNVSQEDISRRAYEIWENQGRPFNQDGGAQDWRQAEEELESQAARDSLLGGPEVSNLDRALPPNERHQARMARHGELNASEGPPPDVTLFAVADAGHFRAYVEDDSIPGATPALRAVDAIDLPAGKETYFSRDTDTAGQFGAKTRSGGASRGSLDERLGEKGERDRRIAEQLAERLQECLRLNAVTSWYFAAAPALHNAVLERISPEVRQTLVESIPKDLVHQPLPALRAHFQAAH
jgi:hypothetical protein